MTLLSKAALEYVAIRRASREIKQSTARNYRTTLLGFCEVIGMKRDIQTVSRLDVERWFSEKATSGIRDSTLRYQYQIVRLFFLWAIDVGYADSNPCAGLKGPKIGQSAPRAMRHQDVEIILTECTEVRDRLIVSLMVQEGLRCVEVARLAASDIDLDDGMLRAFGKGDKERWLPITTETAEVLAEYLIEHPLEVGCPVLRSYSNPERGVTSGHIGRLMSARMLSSGIKRTANDGKSAHALRHTFASSLVEGGADIEDVRLALGHESLTTTAIYMKRHRASDKLRDVMNGRTYRGEVA